MSRLLLERGISLNLSQWQAWESEGQKFIFRFSGCFPEGKKEGRKGGEEGREGGREGGGRKGRLHVRIMIDVLSENPFRAKMTRFLADLEQVLEDSEEADTRSD